MPFVTLVDGVGRPKVIDLPDDLVAPIVIEFAHQGITSGPDCRVKFYRTDETDPAGRTVYRQKTIGDAPAIRGVYLLPWKAMKFSNAPRFGTTGE